MKKKTSRKLSMLIPRHNENDPPRFAAPEKEEDLINIVNCF